MEATRKKELKDLLDFLINLSEDESDANFTNAISISLLTLKIEPKTLAILLDISKKNIENWINGINLPHPIIRPNVYMILAEECVRQLF